MRPVCCLHLLGGREHSQFKCRMLSWWWRRKLFYYQSAHQFNSIYICIWVAFNLLNDFFRGKCFFFVFSQKITFVQLALPIIGWQHVMLAMWLTVDADLLDKKKTNAYRAHACTQSSHIICVCLSVCVCLCGHQLINIGKRSFVCWWT